MGERWGVGHRGDTTRPREREKTGFCGARVPAAPESVNEVAEARTRSIVAGMSGPHVTRLFAPEASSGVA